MKQILIIDESSLFREYLSSILEQAGDFKAQVALNGFDGIIKIKNSPPDLIIMSMYLSRGGTAEVLRQKKLSPDLVNIPVLLLTHKFNQKQIEEFASYRIDKILVKPIKLELLYSFLSKEFKTNFFIDDTKGSINISVNDHIIFVTVKHGLNIDDLDVFNFKVAELIELFDLNSVKVVVIMNDVQINFSEAVNLVRLFQSITSNEKIKYQNIKVISNVKFIQQFFSTYPEFLGIGIVATLKGAVMMLLDIMEKPIHSKISNFEIAYTVGINDLTEITKNINIAVVSNVAAIIESINTVFQNTSVSIKTYTTINEYIENAEKSFFDIIFLDAEIPDMDVFETINKFKKKNIEKNIALMISAKQRETAWNIFGLGITNYIVKPLKSAEVFRQFLQIVYTNF